MSKPLDYPKPDGSLLQITMWLAHSQGSSEKHFRGLGFRVQGFRVYGFRAYRVYGLGRGVGIQNSEFGV